MFMLAVKRKVTFHKISHRPQGEFNIGAWVTDPKQGDVGLKPILSWLGCAQLTLAVGGEERRDRRLTSLGDKLAWASLSLYFLMCLSHTTQEGLPRGTCGRPLTVTGGQNQKKHLKPVRDQFSGTGELLQAQFFQGVWGCREMALLQCAGCYRTTWLYSTLFWGCSK